MKLLILGFSSILQKKILRSFQKIDDICIEIASKSSRSELVTYSDYYTAIKETKADLIYITLVNSLHFYWAKRALDQKKHVIIDKPAVLNTLDANELISLAKKNNCLLAEAVVFNYHDIFEEFYKMQKKSNMFITAEFSFPQLPLDNFRYSKSLGGGAIYDLGPYAASIIRLFLDSKSLSLNSLILSRDINGIDTSFTVQGKDDCNNFFSGYFGFCSEYVNNLKIISKNKNLSINKIFTLTSDETAKLFFQQKNEKSSLEIKSDSFLNFLESCILAIREGNFQSFYDSLLTNINIIEEIKCRSDL